MIGVNEIFQLFLFPSDHDFFDKYNSLLWGWWISLYTVRSWYFQTRPKFHEPFCYWALSLYTSNSSESEKKNIRHQASKIYYCKHGLEMPSTCKFKYKKLVFWRLPSWKPDDRFFFLTDSELFYVYENPNSKKVHGTFGLGWK